MAAAIFNKVLTVNKNMISSGRKDAALNPDEVSILEGLRESLASSRAIPAKSLDLVVRIVTLWPYSDRLAGLDILRCMAKYATVAKYSSDVHGSLIDLAIRSSLPKDETPNENAVMMGARAIANAFATADGRSLASTKADPILAFLERIVGAEGHEAIGKFNRNVLIATSTVALDLAVLVSKENQLLPAHRRRLVVILGEILTRQTDSEVLYRSLVALGTLLSATPESAAGLGIKAWAQTASDKGAEERVKAVSKECLELASR